MPKDESFSKEQLNSIRTIVEESIKSALKNEDSVNYRRVELERKDIVIEDLRRVKKYVTFCERYPDLCEALYDPPLFNNRAPNPPIYQNDLSRRVNLVIELEKTMKKM